MRAVAAPSRPAGAPLIQGSGVDVDVPDLPGQYKSQIQPGPAAKANSCAAAWACRGPQCGNSGELVSGLPAPSNPTFKQAQRPASVAGAASARSNRAAVLREKPPLLSAGRKRRWPYLQRTTRASLSNITRGCTLSRSWI